MEEEFEMEEQHLLNLSLSLVSHTSKVIELASTSEGSSDGGGGGGGECTYDTQHQTEIVRLLRTRHQMLIQDQSSRDSRSNCCSQVIDLLLKSATAMEDSNSAAISNLILLYQSASLVGDSAQRLGAHYADGLTARLLKQERNPFYSTIMKEGSEGDKLMAFTHMYRVSPCYQFSHFTANQSILEAFERELPLNNSQLHVLDMDLAFGLQWPSLIQSLSEKATTENPVSLRITGLGSCLEELQETEARLVGFAKAFDHLEFDFKGLVRGSRIGVLRRADHETLAVNLVLSYFNTNTNPNTNTNSDHISETLQSLRCLSPSIVAVVQREGGHHRIESSLLLGKLMESLHYYAAMFGSLEDCLPRDSVERVCIERDHLGMEMKREMVTASEFGDHARYEGLERWRERMQRFGFQGIHLSTRTTMQAKLLLRMRSHCCHPQFRVVEREDGKALSLGWQDRLLVTATAWRPV